VEACNIVREASTSQKEKAFRRTKEASTRRKKNKGSLPEQQER
jgi:hypothetical protein